ncbi:tripartite tricarboxylate transporter substrate binding protein [Roseomonas sp. AR75]|uniref:tripartite tricarboxylate transporter substrate binding protein n=1 Tax=Roseomonas sp. AR75 TaxID=2562311 RepID=UPI0010C03240|nr:tripartite tricarboxylate transporter substrate binding protein [Roseomonas sp. AR75]
MTTTATRRGLLAGAALAAVARPALAQNWPTRPVTMIVPWAAGGGTDATGRIVATLLEREIGRPVNVVNRTGGGGLVGHTEIANARADGYTIGVITTELSLYRTTGAGQIDWKNYTPIALYNTDPQGVHVRADGPRDLATLIAQIRERPGANKASGANLGGAAHLGLVGMLNALGLPPTAAPWVPTDGAAPSLQQLAAGAIQLVTTTMPEAKTMVDAGQVRTIAIMRPTRDPAYPNVPTVKEAVGVDWSLGAWRGIAGPRNLPEAITTRLRTAMGKVVADPEFIRLMGARSFGIEYVDGPAFGAWLETADKRFGDAARAAGLAR